MPSFAFSSDGATLAVGERHGVRLISVSDGTVLGAIVLEEPFWPLTLAFRPDETLAMAVEEVRGLPREKTSFDHEPAEAFTTP